MTPDSPYRQQKKNTNLLLSWFVIGGGLLGIGAYLTPKAQGIREGDLGMVGVLGAIAVVLIAIAFMVGFRGVRSAMKEATENSQEFKGKLFTAGGLFSIPVLVGVIGQVLTQTWWVYILGMVVLAGVTFGTLIPSSNELYGRLEVLLRRKKDGGEPAATKKTTYEL